MSTKNPQTPQTPETNATALTDLLVRASNSSNTRFVDFLNSTNPDNSENHLFMPYGILYGKDNKGNRNTLMRILLKYGVQVQGENPASKIVVFPQDFQRVISDVVKQFLSNLGLVSSAKPVATGGGGAALPNSDSSLLTNDQLELWLHHILLDGTPILRQNLFNKMVALNTDFTDLFTNGFLSVRLSRDLLMEILISNGVVLQGNHPTQYVVFPPNFQNSVSTILEAFFESLQLILDNDDKQSVPVATGGGGAALHKSSTHQSKTDKLLTFEFQKTHIKSVPNGSENKTLECVVCPHTNNDSSGKCSSRSCGLFHPINTTSVKVKSQCSESGDPFISARICCHHSTHGQCRLGNECRFAHLSSNEYERFQSQDESHPKIQNLNPT